MSTFTLNTLRDALASLETSQPMIIIAVASWHSSTCIDITVDEVVGWSWEVLRPVIGNDAVEIAQGRKGHRVMVVARSVLDSIPRYGPTPGALHTLYGVPVFYVEGPSVLDGGRLP